VGPLCTDAGQFWLHFTGEPVVPGDAPARSLAVLPITALDANPWHHCHWWIPALWQLRLRMRLRPEEVRVALAFPRPDADFTHAVRRPIEMEDRDGTMRRSELPLWTYLDPDWPSVPDGSDVRRAWRAGGLHEEILAMLTDRPATSLAELSGLPFRRVVFGVPSLRWTVHTPQLRCPQVGAVRALVHSAAQAVAHRGRSRAARPARKLRLRFVQREVEEGRFIVNLHGLVEQLKRDYGRELLVDVLPTGALRNASWTAQFRLFSAADVVAGAEGAALAWMWALPRGGASVEFRPWETPPWVPCSRSWDDPAAAGATFPGLARLAGLHHVCVRTVRPAPARTTPIARPYRGWEAWKGSDLFIDLRIAQEVVREALDRVKGPKPSCEGSWWGSTMA